VLLGAAAFVFWKFPLRVFDPVPPESGHAVAITPLTYLFTQFSVIVKYIQLLIIPVNLHLEYDFPVAQQFTGLRTVTGFLILSSLFVLAVVFRRRERILSFGIFWFFLTLSVESGIIPIRDVLVEHRTYLPSFGFFLILATGIYRLLGDRSALAAALLWGFLAVTWSVMTYQRNRVWKDDLTLLTDNIEKAPAFARPYSNRGVIWWKQKEYEKAVADFSAAIAINPGYRDAWYNRGVVYEETGRYEEAAADYSQAVALDPEHIKAWYNRGVVHFHLGKYAEAVNDYSRAIAIDPGYADAWNNRGVAYFRLHENEKALEGFSTALKLRPDYADAWSNRGAAMFELGRYADAVADYSQAIVLRPDYKEAFVNRAIAYGNMEKWELAAADYARAMEIDPALTQLAGNLAIARKKAGISTR